MKKYIFALCLLALPVSAFCQSSLRCRELDVNNIILRLQSQGYHVLSAYNQTLGSFPADAIWVIIYE